MSFEITTAFTQQYGSSVEFLAQQKGSRLRRAVTIEPNVVGKTAYFDQIGSVAARRVTQRHGDSPLNPTPHARRRVTMWDYDTGDLIDSLDKVRTLIDPTNPYTMAHGWAMGRGMDDEIINALGGTAYTGEDGSTSVALPSAQKIVVGAAGLTVGKLIEAKEILDASEATDPDEPRFIVTTAKQITNMLSITEVTSSDYNTVKALAKGEVNSFMGFDFIRSERLKVDGSSNRLCYAWVPSGVKLGIGKEPVSRLAERSDKRFSMYVYYCMALGATRLQEEKVVEIACSES